SAKFDLLLALVEGAAGIEGVLEYDADLFDRTTAERLLERFERVLDAFADAPGLGVGDVLLFGAVERAQILLEWNDTAAEFPRRRGLHHLFAEQAARTPGGTALVHGDERITYH